MALIAACAQSILGPNLVHFDAFLHHDLRKLLDLFLGGFLLLYWEIGVFVTESKLFRLVDKLLVSRGVGLRIGPGWQQRSILFAVLPILSIGSLFADGPRSHHLLFVRPPRSRC